ncbi:MAG: GatB/YqeY domain-containing protein [Patescibacteria group bacterium]
MALKQQVQNDLTESVKGKEELRSSVLRLLLSAINNKETEKRTKIWKEKPKASVEDLEKESKLTDEEIISVISSEIKKRRESIELFGKGGKQEMADKEKKEMEFLQKYLPEQMSEADLRKLVKEAIAKVGAKEQKDMGRVMAELMPKIKGKADGSLISKVVKELLIGQK